MYSSVLTERIIKLLAPDGYTQRSASEKAYPERQLVKQAVVTRSAPSPTGMVHIGTIYMSLINKLVALNSHGINILRIEDTDKQREVENGVETITKTLELFNLKADEGVNADGSSYGDYGPYLQSDRQKIYLGFAIDLLQKGRAYPDFATKQELEITYKKQQAAKIRPGYYGEYALWRDRTESEISEALDAGLPFVLRFKSDGNHSKRTLIKDVLKGTLELPENDLDVPLIKSDASRLPTYHLAHVIDDYLMKTNIILRGDEWLPSTPLHVELCEALGIKPFRYAHFAPISIMDGASKRKLSKRKDPQADVKFFIEAGYPIEAILEYLLRLANSNFEEWRNANPKLGLWDFSFSFEKWSKSRGALLDMTKLEDVCKNYISELSQDKFARSLLEWAHSSAPYLEEAIDKDKDYAIKVLAIEREGEQKRKDLSKWSDAPEHYGYFFDELFSKHFASRIKDELDEFPDETISRSCVAFLKSYNSADDQSTWLNKMRSCAEETVLSMKDFAKILRVKLTGKNRSPDLYQIMKVMGTRRLEERLLK